MFPTSKSGRSLDLKEVEKQLWQKANSSTAGRAAMTVYHGAGIRQTMVVIRANEYMTEHHSPPEGFIHVINGSVRVDGTTLSWLIDAGHLLPVPDEKHSVTALEHTVMTLTVLRQAVVRDGALENRSTNS